MSTTDEERTALRKEVDKLADDLTIAAAARRWAKGAVGLPPVELEAARQDRIAVWTGLTCDPARLADAALAEVRGNGAKSAAADPAQQGASVFIDWSTFWARDHNEAEWVYPDVLARGRGHALYAVHKEGKSLFMLYLAATLATGSEPIVVVYFDYEMTEADLIDRLEDMGYGPGTDLSRLRYALLPTLPPLDTAAGAVALMDIVDGVQSEWPDHHVVVIIDTISRAVAGEENSADTFRAFYSHTGIELKRRGITWARLDHGGKDATRGQRGSSGKGDDVDVVWKLVAEKVGEFVNSVSLKCDFARMAWVPHAVVFDLTESPLRYERRADEWPKGTGALANILDRLGVPLDASTREASCALQAAKEGRRRQLVVAAIRWRRKQRSDPGTTAGTTPADEVG